MKPMKPRADGRFARSKRTPEGRKWGYGSTVEEAEADLQSKLSPSLTPPSLETKGGSLHELANRYWLPSLGQLARFTKSRYISAYANHVYPTFGDKRPADIDRGMVQEWVNDLTSRLSSASVHMAALVLGQIVDIAIEEELIAKDPCRKLKLPKRRVDRERALPIETLLILLTRAKETPLSCPVYLAAVLGLRRGEICGLKWEDLDRPNGTLKIRRQRQQAPGGPREADPKWGSARTLELSEMDIAEIDARGNLDSPYVCTNLGRPWRPDSLTRVFDKAKEGFGLPDEWTLHDLRHLAGMLLDASGVQLTGIAAVLGHATTKQSERYVTRATGTKKEDAAKRSKTVFG